MTGNSLIDEDMGNDYRSPEFNTPAPIEVGLEVYFWNSDDKKWELAEEKDLEDIAVCTNELYSLIEDEVGDSFDINNITVIKNNADHVIVNHWIQENEVEKYEMFYK